ncbi:MAG TPA: adenosylmethionine decarboxylase [Acetomicrobium flavidum]|uniref:S-adenosylmethionine decarboxylase proenzyme n=2 Tax=Acetomicrobium TaxID=49894 RepID=I4BVN6_ACEMN|nr:adenosylmethionine decarboxylase [Acetomicrobium mobile]SIN63499.1 S-adenosylmethionine decarboxylase [Acetomicrobium flavidum]AFM21343.1 S-adenosylmethionine decarboxylase proenzyme [Acetomicrobium mobile DSM 13181]HOJ82099.1 adenosylmethionine decarboxylase [Acetomicrobium flavidum]HOM31217.1 adenosylmethionine decarboxylase [Acetomicrobium flavidum]HOP87306.1 adenosylmethionine decarboxylase [Acetomicrobium flavidum]
MTNNQALGKHILMEAYDCEYDVLDDLRGIQSAMIEAAERTGATVVDVAFRKFEPYGVSGVVIISESHLAIHTWPEFGYAAIDLFTCGDKADPWKAFEYLSNYFKPKKITTMEIRRGSLVTTDNKNYVSIDSIRESVKGE